MNPKRPHLCDLEENLSDQDYNCEQNMWTQRLEEVRHGEVHDKIK